MRWNKLSQSSTDGWSGDPVCHGPVIPSWWLEECATASAPEGGPIDAMKLNEAIYIRE